MPVIIGLWAVFTVVVFWNALRIKTVKLEGEALLIKGYLKEVPIPLGEITKIKAHLFLRPHWTIHLKTPTVFGTTIAFIPKRRIATSDGNKSTFAELQARIARA